MCCSSIDTCCLSLLRETCQFLLILADLASVCIWQSFRTCTTFHSAGWTGISSSIVGKWSSAIHAFPSLLLVFFLYPGLVRITLLFLILACSSARLSFLLAIGVSDCFILTTVFDACGVKIWFCQEIPIIQKSFQICGFANSFSANSGIRGMMDDPCLISASWYWLGNSQRMAFSFRQRWKFCIDSPGSCFICENRKYPCLCCRL